MIRFWVIPFGLAIAATLIFRQSGSLRDTILAWAIAINVVAFLIYGYDKAISSGSKRTRAPEMVLLALAFAGGWPLAYAAMLIYEHKISKDKVGSAARSGCS